MKDIVIPYQKNMSGELDTCLALIKKNVPHRNIYVIEAHDNRSRMQPSHINQILKLKWALDNLDLTEDFYLFNDDFFVLEKVNDIPYYHKGRLDSQPANRFGGGYAMAVRHTKDFLGSEALSYELHVPFLFNTERLSALIKLLEPNLSTRKCPLIRSTYGNLYSVGGEYMEDVKNINDYHGKTYLSTNEGSFKRGIGDYIRSKV